MDKLDETLTEFIHQRTPGNWRVIYGWTDSAILGKKLISVEGVWNIKDVSYFQIIVLKNLHNIKEDII